MIQELENTFVNKAAFFLLCGVIIFTTLFYGAVHQPIIAIVYLLAVMIVLFWAVDGFLTGSLSIHKSKTQLALLAFTLVAIIQIIPFGSLAETAGVAGISRTISLEPYWTKLTAFHILAVTIFLAGNLVFINSARRLRRVVMVLTIFGFIYAFYAILQSVLSPNRIYGVYEAAFANPFGSFVNRHNFAAFIEMTIAIPLGLLFVGAIPQDKRLLYVTAVGLMGVALIMSGSRGGFVAFLAEVFFIIIVTSNTVNKRQIVLKIGASVLLLAVIIGGAVYINNETTLTRIAETAEAGNITTNRTQIWSVTLDVIKDNPVFGAGIGAFDIAYSRFDPSNGTERVEQAHNDYLQVLADAGIIGAMIGLFFLYSLFRHGRNSLKTPNLFRRGVALGALAGCFAILIHSLFDFVLHTTAISLTFLMLVALVVRSGNDYPDDTEDRMERHKRRKKQRLANITPFNKIRKKVGKKQKSTPRA